MLSPETASNDTERGLEVPPCSLAYTRYPFTLKLCARVSHPCIASPPLYCPHYCNTIARSLCSVRPPTAPPIVFAMHHTILVRTISCKGALQR